MTIHTDMPSQEPNAGSPRGRAGTRRQLGVLLLAAVTALAASTLPPTVARAERTAVPPAPSSQSIHSSKQARRHKSRLGNNRTYRRLINGPRSSKLKLLLTGVSTLLLAEELPKSLVKALRTNRLEAAVRDLHGYYTATGSYPTGFTKRLDRSLKATARAQRLGVWSKEDNHDYAALAAWHKNGRADYQRALIAARRAKVGAWSELTNGHRPHGLVHLFSERDALERIARSSRLSRSERMRLQILKNPPKALGEEVQVGSLVYVVDEAETMTSLGFAMARLDARPGSRFVVIHCSIENPSDKRVPLHVQGFRLSDGKQRRHKPSTRATGALALVEDGGEVALAEIEAGDGHALALAFEVSDAETKAPLFLSFPSEKGAPSTTVAFEVKEDEALDEEPLHVLDTM